MHPRLSLLVPCLPQYIPIWEYVKRYFCLPHPPSSSRSFSLVLFYGRSGLRDASGKQVCLDSDFLLRQQVDLCVESLISGKGDLDPVFPGADEHPMSSAAEFADGSGKSVVHKNGGSLRCDLQLDL